MYAQEVNSPAISAVKFSSLFIEDSRNNNQLTFGIQAKKAKQFEGIVDLKKAAQKSLEYFFIGLSFPDDKFWVNLNPNEPNSIIDSTLANTDFGRILLNADLRLKKDFCELTGPNSPIGKEFWRRLYAKAQELGIGNTLSINTRLWIVPDEVFISEAENKASIIESKLMVCLEADALAPKGIIQDEKEREFQEYASHLMEEMLLPFLGLKVNDGYAYADLRDVYQALILARWYKQKWNGRNNSIAASLKGDIIKELETNFFYTIDDVYQEYVRSFKDGEYSLKEKEGGIASTTVIRRYASGGINLVKTEFRIAGSSITPEDKDTVLFICQVSLPAQSAESPLRYAKNNSRVMQTSSNSLLSLLDGLPTIAAIATTSPIAADERKKVIVAMLDSNL